jgi:hypothetical protein
MNGMFSMFNSGNAHYRAAKAEMEAARNLSKVKEARRDFRFLEGRIDKLLLVCGAMWELLRERTGLTEEDLTAKVQEVDLRDGVQDGKVTKEVLKCVKCGRTLSRRHHCCLYCGARELNPQAFDAAE